VDILDATNYVNQDHMRVNYTRKVVYTVLLVTGNQSKNVSCFCLDMAQCEFHEPTTDSNINRTSCIALAKLVEINILLFSTHSWRRPPKQWPTWQVQDASDHEC
jgi:hypothetical protein